MTQDASKAGTFYSQLFPWRTEAMSMPGMTYTLFKRGDASAAGMMQIQPEMGPIPSHWLSYFMVDDADAKIARAQSLGAQILVPAQTVPNVGRFAILKDAQGAPFGVLGPEKSS